MICMARTFGAPLSVPAGKHAASASIASRSGRKRPSRAEYQVHDVRVAFDVHQVLHFDGTVVADATQIVASKVDKHDVFGSFFFVGAHFLLECGVGGFVPAARMSTQRWDGIRVCGLRHAPAFPATIQAHAMEATSWKRYPYAGNTCREKGSPVRSAR